jgi:hypothetical protein
MRIAATACVITLLLASQGSSAQGVQSTPAAASKEPKPLVELILEPDQIDVPSDSKFQLYAKLVNQSKGNISCISAFASSGIDEGYAYDVRTIDGKPVLRVPGKIEQSRMFWGPCGVAPGSSLEISLGCVMCAFEMRKPGVSTVQVTYRNGANPELIMATSNKLTVTVRARE